MFVNVLVAIYASGTVNYSNFKKIKKAIIFALTAGAFSGFMGAVTQRVLFGVTENPVVGDLIIPLERTFGFTPIGSFYVACILINLLDKAITTFVAYLVVFFTPPDGVEFYSNCKEKGEFLLLDRA